MATTKQSSIANSAQSPDWTVIERAYTETNVSVRQIAAEHGVSHTAIGKKASTHGWVRPEKLEKTVKKKLEKKSSVPTSANDCVLTKVKREEPEGRVIKDCLPSGHQVHFSQAICDAICDRLVGGESLRSICEADGMPHIATVMRWLADPSKKAFCEQYARAREMQMNVFADELAALHEKAWVPVLDDTGLPMLDAARRPYLVVDKSSAAVVKLEADNKKWLMSKMAPKKYGDKLALGGAEDLGPLQLNRDLTDAERAVRLVRALNEAPEALQMLAGAVKAGAKA